MIRRPPRSTRVRSSAASDVYKRQAWRLCESGWMRSGISISLSPSDRDRLYQIMKDRNAAQKHAWRAGIVLLTSDGVGTNEIMRRTGTSKSCVWRWQERFMQEGVEGLLRDKTRPLRIPTLTTELVAWVVSLPLPDVSLG